MNLNTKRMKQLLLIFTLLFQFCSCSASGHEHTIRIGIISDTHYLSEKLMDDGAAVKSYIQSSGKNIAETPEVLDRVLAEYLNSDIEILLIPGDMTKDGEKQSHLDFVEKLKPLQSRGVKVFVIPGNHDINMPNSVGYKGNSSYNVENISPSEFADIYSSCGYSQAINRDTASLSYVSVLDKNTWLLAIDGCLYKQYTTQSLSEGQISEQTEAWMLSMLSIAKRENKKIIAMMHHGLVEHFPMQGTFLPQYLIKDYQRLSETLADNGVKVIFTGHFHSNDISEFKSSNGNSLYDIETGALSAFPFPYRFAELTKDSISISTKHITEIASNPLLKETSRAMLKKSSGQLILQKLRSRFNFDEETARTVEDVASEIFILHIQGDEVIDDNLKAKIKEIADKMDLPIDLSPEFFQIDFPPADNNVTLPL